MSLSPNFYANRVCLNVLAGSHQNAIDIYQAAQGHVLVGMLSKDYPDTASAAADMKACAEKIENALSIGLGAGDPKQSDMVTALAGILQPQHVNQVFTGVGATRQALGQNHTIVNGLISPSGTVGLVKISTGPKSSGMEEAVVPVDTAIAMLQDMGCSSVKFFPMQGLKCKAEYQEVANACARHHFWLEPTGGIDLDNFEEILRIALDAGVEKVIPHIYSSIIDEKTGQTRPEDVKTLLAMTQKQLAHS
ncbi:MULTISPECIES: 2-dehydro-3-deoxy-phosphogluconate aldolase [unclassified Vibrio]|uniref:2-dehydro-3-deoxy-phosphogluconate aldolase n=1 Tax=unclassified Vibrio TaxID=2614977 RepID=UPI000645DE7A|nr:MULTISPECIES: KDGP aldolase family protein [unclassified Vibrio]NAX16801.1 oxo-acid lyase [Vibrio sp. V22_P2S10T140]OXX47948.1 2-dehydro-3-deoxyphosphooctonate aldolase [Vibrio sp. V07_P2A8T137]OXX62381.1 2-dehydro-3-deoxyphosphooctonate aldolase [Vibrio sp. V10_P2A27P122]PSD40677.1 oxo-acid lyase [Vibrio sp. V02_P2A34T13]